MLFQKTAYSKNVCFKAQIKLVTFLVYLLINLFLCMKINLHEWHEIIGAKKNRLVVPMW